MQKTPALHVIEFGENRQQNPPRGSILETAGPLDVSQVKGLYLHIPFCFHKCHYCDFYSIVDAHDRQEAFVRRLCDEIRVVGEIIDGPIETVFFGGGTPTLLAPTLWKDLFAALGDGFRLSSGCEFTVEANPETVTLELAETLGAGGVNRISIGAQSFHAAHLKTLEREHDPANVKRALEHFRTAGIHDINLDLISAIPGQSLSDWKDDLKRALELQPTHLSCYTLMYEPNTPLTVKLHAGHVDRVEEETEAAMYEMTIDDLAEAGYEQYEISNWAQPGYRCRHNVMYWRNGSWWPFGPSASGHVNGTRWKNLPRLQAYLESSGLSPVVDVERLDAGDRAGEALMLGLRLLDGVPIPDLDNLLAVDGGEVRERAIDRAIADGLLERTTGAIRLTRRGLLLADTVLASVI